LPKALSKKKVRYFYLGLVKVEIVWLRVSLGKMNFRYPKTTRNRVKFRHKKALTKKMVLFQFPTGKTLIFGHVAMFLDDSLHPPGHRAAQIAQGTRC
jgi:hypothetical protein